MSGKYKLLIRVFCLALFWGGSAIAGDGVVEINQACAVNGGCFSGDTAGYPVTVDGTAGGSYLLTSNLIVPDENTIGIEVVASDISIDLNGFSIVRSGCEGALTPCTVESGIGAGVFSNSSYYGVTVKNGSVTGMGRRGVRLGYQAQAIDLRLRWNRLDGVFVYIGSTVTGVTAHGNGGDGIAAGSGSVVSGNAASNNGGDGIQANGQSTVIGNTANGNEGHGIFANADSTVSDNAAIGNTGNGIFANTGSTISNNTVNSNQDHGIEALADCTVQGNTVRGNTGRGLSLSNSAAYKDNVINDNTLGTVSGGVNMLGNSCNGTAVCP